MDFGRILKEARVKKNMTQDELALKLGVAKSTISGYENGTREPDVPKIKILMSVLSIEPETLFGEHGKRSMPVSDSQELRLLDTFRQLNPEGQDKVVSYADDLLSSGRYIKSDPIPWAERA